MSRADSENMDVSDATCFESDIEVAVREIPVLVQKEQIAYIVVPSNGNVTINTVSNIEKCSTSATQLHQLLATKM